MSGSAWQTLHRLAQSLNSFKDCSRPLMCLCHPAAGE